MNSVTNLLTEIVSTFTSIPQSTWAGFASLLSAGVVVSVITELYKRHRITKKEAAVAKSFLGLIITVLSVVFTLAQSLVVYGAVNPSFLGVHTAQLMGFVSAVYLFGGSAVYKKVASFLSRLRQAFAALDGTPTTTTGTTASATYTTTVSATPVVDSSVDLLT